CGGGGAYPGGGPLPWMPLFMDAPHAPSSQFAPERQQDRGRNLAQFTALRQKRGAQPADFLPALIMPRRRRLPNDTPAAIRHIPPAIMNAFSTPIRSAIEPRRSAPSGG